MGECFCEATMALCCSLFAFCFWLIFAITAAMPASLFVLIMNTDYSAAGMLWRETRFLTPCRRIATLDATLQPPLLEQAIARARAREREAHTRTASESSRNVLDSAKREREVKKSHTPIGSFHSLQVCCPLTYICYNWCYKII